MGKLDLTAVQGPHRSALEHGELEAAVHRRLESGDAKLAVALHGVTVPSAEHRSWD
jgi:hypothetical protein